MTFQHAQLIFILRRAVAIGESFSKLGVLSRGPSLSLFDMLLAMKESSRT
jgi:hypothetical protein